MLSKAFDIKIFQTRSFLYILGGGILLLMSLSVAVLPLSYVAILMAMPVALIVSVLTLKYFEQALLIICYLAPFYYLPIYLSNEILNARAIGTADYWATFWLRAGKDAIIVVLVIFWILRVFLKRKLRVTRSPVTYAVLAFMLFGFIRSLNPYAFGVLTGLRIFVEYTIFYFIAQDVFDDRRYVRALVRGWIISSAIVSILGLIEFASGRVNYDTIASGQTRITSTLIASNALGWYLVWASSLAVGLYVRIHNSQRKTKLLLILVLALNTLAILLTGSRSSLLLLFLVIAFALFWTGNMRLLLTLSFFLLPLLFGGIYLFQNISGETQLRAISQTNAAGASLTSERVKRAEETFANVFGNNNLVPIIGYGYTSQEIIASNNPDSQYLSLLYSGGVVGLILIGLVVIVALSNASFLLFHQDTLALSLFLSIAVTIVLGIGSNILTLFPHALFFWIAVGLVPQIKELK